ncbi:MAG: metallophosphoesterase family protein [Nitrospirota bacterium]
MKYAVVSDIHANIEAFTAVLAEIDQQQIDQIICLGDTVGYYTNPNECLDIIRERNVQSIAGNHDRAGTGLKEPIPGCGVFGRRAISWTRPRLTPENATFLDQLPITRVIDNQFLLVHGTLYPTPNEEIYLTGNPDVLQRNFNVLLHHEAQVKIVFFGHTHHALAYHYSDGTIGKFNPPEDVRLNASDYYFINPGSVGQSRDDDPRAAFLTYDTKDSLVRFHRVDYNHALSHKKAKKEGLPYDEHELTFRKFVGKVLDGIGAKAWLKRQLKKIKGK